MYCRKCGKKIDYDAEICVECQENEELFTRVDETPAQPTYEYTQPFRAEEVRAPQDKGSRMCGFGLALAGVIVSEFAIVFAYFMLVLMLAGGMAGLMMLPFSAAAAIFSLIAGIKSIKTSKACVDAGKVKPIPTFIMGIVATVSAGIALFVLVLAFMMIGAVA